MRLTMKVGFKHIQIGMMFILSWNLIRENLFLSIVYLTESCMIIRALDQNEKLYNIFYFLWQKMNCQCIEIDSFTASNAAASLSTSRKFLKSLHRQINQVNFYSVLYIMIVI